MSQYHMNRISTCGAAVLAALIFCAPRAAADTTSYRVGALATASSAATEIGEQIFVEGGNAIDVAVAVGFALAVSFPEAGNIGGGGFAVVRVAKADTVVALDFREMAPSAATETMYLDSTGNVIDSLSLYGAKASGVPGTVAGLYELWRFYGSLPWERLVRPAAQLAYEGVLIDAHLAASLARNDSLLRLFPETEKIFLPEGRPPQAGELLVQRDLSRTLLRIAEEGPRPFYQSDIAGKIAATMRNRGGLITREDLANYRPVWREPVHVVFDSLDIYSMPPPSSGGICVGQILELLEVYDFSGYGSTSPEYVHLFCEAARLAYADRSMHLGDPDFWEAPALLDSGYLAERRELINRDTARASLEILPGSPPREPEQTTHFSVCDSAGNMVSITYTLNTSFGSGLVVEGAGFLLNNEMDDFSIKPGVPNVYGLIGGEANKIEPGKRMLSSMSPTVILKQGQPHLILGTPGGSKIITTVAEAILAYVRFGKSPHETVAAPRFHHQWVPDVLQLEEASWSPETTTALRALGYTVQKTPAWCDLQLVAIDSSGAMIPASDPRRGGTGGGR